MTAKQCWECHRRRLVCDRSLPHCRKCHANGVACPGYADSRPLKWLQPQQVKSKQRGRRRDDNPDLETRQDESGLALVPKTPVPSSLQPDRAVVEIFEAIEYYNTQICPDLLATGLGGPASPFFMPQAAASWIPRACIESLICTSVCHRLLQSGDARTAADKAVLWTRLHRHRGEAIRQLTTLLGDPDEQASDATLASVIVLLLFEIQQTFSPVWRKHSDGAAAIISMGGGLGNMVFTKPWLRHLLRYYVIIDVMGCTTSPAPDLPTAQRQLELINLMAVLYENGLLTCLPCPPDLFVQIIRVNHLRAQFRSIREPDAADARHTAAMDILRRVRAYPVEEWAMEATTSMAQSSTDSAPRSSGWLSMARIFQCAVALYCIATVCDTNHSGPGSTLIAAARESCRIMLVQQLQSITTCRLLRKLLLWPLMVAGLETDDADTQRFILDELAWLSKDLGIAAPLLGRQFLRTRVWPVALQRRTWEKLFDRDYLFAC